jgi:methylenetetrahydrofolate reductase (NADPH)
MDLMTTGHLDGFARLDIAGHPEGNRDIDPDGGMAHSIAALREKQDFARDTGCQMGIVTQFAFDAAPVVTWMARLRDAGITLPVHLGLAGPAKLQTLLKYAIACGVGPSLSVLQKRARDMTKLLVPV